MEYLENKPQGLELSQDTHTDLRQTSLCNYDFNPLGLCSGSNQPIWESKEDGRRYHTGLCQEQQPVSCDDLKVSLCVASEGVTARF